jgi:nonribosomal peptide synthetase DhbF
MRLLSRIRSRLDAEIAIRVLFEAPSVAALGHFLVSGQSSLPAFNVVRPIRQPGRLRPLFCIHPVGGLSWCYSGLTHHIPSDYPIYGLQARTERHTLPTDISEMAKDYLTYIRQIQPTGPYNLLGWSFGGLVAHEIATILQNCDQEVSLLALLDSYPSQAANLQYAPVDEPDEREFFLSLIGPYGYDRGALEQFPLQNTLDILRRHGETCSEIEEQDLNVLLDVFKNNMKLAINFLPRRFNGDILFFHASKEHFSTPVEAWKLYVSGQVKVHHIDSEHNKMMEPAPLAYIGRILAAELAKIA